MFFCEDCRQKNRWPESFSQSRGPCEVCGQSAFCHDVPSGQLPAVPEDRVQQVLDRMMEAEAESSIYEEEDFEPLEGEHPYYRSRLARQRMEEDSADRLADDLEDRDEQEIWE